MRLLRVVVTWYANRAHGRTLGKARAFGSARYALPIVTIDTAQRSTALLLEHPAMVTQVAYFVANWPPYAGGGTLGS